MTSHPFQPHSETSREAAESVTASTGQRAEILREMEKRGSFGATIDEMAVHLTEWSGLGVVPGTASARIGELEDAGQITKTPLKRKTRAGRSAYVYVFGSWGDLVAPKPKNSKAVIEPKESPRQLQARIGHGHVIPRTDGFKAECGGELRCAICGRVDQYFRINGGRNE